MLETFTTPWICYARGKVYLMNVRLIHSPAEWFSNFNGNKTYGEFGIMQSQVPPPERASGGLERDVESAILIRAPGGSDVIGLQTTLRETLRKDP